MVIALLLSAAAAQIPASRQLPTPSGSLPIGTEVGMMTDTSRAANPDSTGGTGRMLRIQIWYPAQTAAGSRAPYLPDSGLAAAMDSDQYMNVPAATIAAWRKLTTHARASASVRPGRFPLVFFAPGFGMSRVSYTELAEDLASHGYLVVTVDHTGSGFVVLPGRGLVSIVRYAGGPDAHAAEISADTRFLAGAALGGAGPFRRLRGHIDAQRIAAVGHSLGGAAALNDCREARPFVACIDLDGAPFGPAEDGGIRNPYLVLLNEPGGEVHPSDSMRVERDAEWKRVIGGSSGTGRVVKILGASHFSFSDMPYVAPDSLMFRTGAVMNPAQTAVTVTSLIRAFLDAAFSGSELGRFDRVVGAMSEAFEATLSQ